MKRVIFLIFLASLLTACGADTEQPRIQEPVSEISEAETPEAEINAAETSEAETPEAETMENIPEQENSVSFQVDPELEEAGYSFELEDTDGLIERFNGYTNELKYKFMIDKISVEGKIYESINKVSINFLFSGCKVYDCLGDDTKRNILQNIRIKDSSGTVVASADNFDYPCLKTGEKFEDLKIRISEELPPGKYFIDINTPPDNNFSPVKENKEYFNPEKYYTTAVIRNILENGAELPFDISSEWVYDLKMNEIYVDENLMLYGIFSEPYDLNNAKLSKLDNSEDSLISDFQYGDTYYYDITDFKTLPDNIPEEAIPSVIRVSVSRDGSIIAGERESFYVFFNYKHKPDDEYSYIALGFESHPANAITQKEWNDIVSCAEEDDIPMSELLEKD